MKTMCVVFAFLAVFAVQAQTTNSPGAQKTLLPAPVQPVKKLQPIPQQLTNSEIQASSAQSSGTEPLLLFDTDGQTRAVASIFREPRPNEVISGRLTYSGIAIEATKTKNPLQMLNPLAPPQYGSPEDNVVRDVITRKVVGLKFFAIQF
jgi:hypothetical protein